MRRMILAAVTTLITMGLLDAIWLTTMTARLYRRQLADLLLDHPDLRPAIAFYLLYAVGVLILVVLPAREYGWTLPSVIVRAVLLGVVAYGTYDLTNQATLRGWSPLVTVVDMAWGGLLTAVVASIAVTVVSRFE